MNKAFKKDRFDKDLDVKIKKEFKQKEKAQPKRFCKHENRYIGTDDEECEQCIEEILNNE